MPIKLTYKFMIMFLILGLCWGVSLAAGVEFSADMTMTDGKGKVVSGKIFVKAPDKIRQETTVEGQTSVTILRMDKKLSWALMPQQQQYMEVALPVNPNEPNKEYEYDMVSMGNETVNGYVCKVTKYIYKNKKYGEMTQWIAEKLQYSVRVKTVDSSGKTTMTIDYTNIKQTPQADSLFEVPAGYTKFAMPNFKIPST